jgi:hypothetical protein
MRGSAGAGRISAAPSGNPAPLRGGEGDWRKTASPFPPYALGRGLRLMRAGTSSNPPRFPFAKGEEESAPSLGTVSSSRFPSFSGDEVSLGPSACLPLPRRAGEGKANGITGSTAEQGKGIGGRRLRLFRPTCRAEERFAALGRRLRLMRAGTSSNPPRFPLARGEEESAPSPDKGRVGEGFVAGTVFAPSFLPSFLPSIS